MTTAITRRDADDLDTMTLGQVLSKSGYFQDAREASQAIVKVLAGRELGFPAIASMTGVHIIKGRVSLSANLIAAAIKRSKPAYNYRVTELTDKVCTIVFYEDGEECGVSTFTVEDAKKAETQNMHKFPRNMLFARALSNGAKWYCAAIFGGPVYTPEELGAEVDGETGEPIDVTPPQPQVTVIEPDPRQPLRDELKRVRLELGEAGGRPSNLTSSQVARMTIEQLQEEIAFTRDEITSVRAKQETQAPELFEEVEA